MNRYEELKSFDEKLRKEHGNNLVGVDEVGMGAWAGPIVACALVLQNAAFQSTDLGAVDDCKRLSPRMRETAYAQILPFILEAQYEFISPREIDVIGIQDAGHQARSRAFGNLRLGNKGVVVVDGNIAMNLTVPCQAVVKADTKSLTVAASSVLAKVTRDRYMRDLSRAYPGYGWSTNVGYGSREHGEGLQQYGLTPYHRVSFQPVKLAGKMSRKADARLTRISRSFRQSKRTRKAHDPSEKA